MSASAMQGGHKNVLIKQLHCQTRHRASTSMYLLTFHVCVMLP